MDLQLSTRQLDGAIVVEVRGEVELANTPQLRSALLRVCEGHPLCLVLDLAAVTFIDSSGIGVLVATLRQAREHGGVLMLVCPQERVRRVLRIAGLVPTLPLFDTLDAALAQCPHSAPAGRAAGKAGPGGGPVKE